ncbi:MAG: phosphonate C-P lyase system protein PhnG [Rhizobiales bacterium]|nr:phosphonate C-P lyase system protein PhnG [Hyphomicrobiales bacterium]
MKKDQAQPTDTSAEASGRLRLACAIAVARGEELGEAYGSLSTGAAIPVWRYVRRPEVGLVMARGRMGGGGAPFNLGEVTAVRCAIALDTGETGFSTCLGRDRRKAAYGALFDALWQREEWRGAVEKLLVEPVLARQSAEDEMAAREVAATRVEFFTMARGEDK